MKKLFIDENIFDIGTLSTAQYGFFETGGKCIIENIEEREYLVQCSNDSLRAGDNKKTEDKNLVLSMISIVEEPDVWSWQKVREYLPLTKIEKWCSKYGFPYWDAEIWNKYHKQAVQVNTFCNWVSAMYLIYKLLQAINEGDSNKLNKYTLVLLRYPEFKSLNEKSFDEYKNKFLRRDFESRKGTANYTISLIINHHIKNIDIQLSLEEKPKFYLQATCIFDICFFQLANMISKNISDAKHIKTCKCGNLFWGHGNQSYCPNCNRKTLHSQKKRNVIAAYNNGIAIDRIASQFDTSIEQIRKWIAPKSE